MRCSIFFILMLSCQLGLAQFTFPKLPPQTDKIENIIPKNWKLIDSAKGDLNNDQQVDLVLILEYQTPITETRAYGNQEIELIREFQKPRMMAIYFKNRQNNKYKLALQNQDFILRSEEGGKLGDPLKDIRIDNNKLTLSFEGGGDWRWKLNYGFQFQGKNWILVNANNIYYNKDSGDMIDKQYDFIDRKITTVIGSIFKRNISNYSSEDILVFTQPRTFDDLKKPWTWEVTQDNYL